jgi:hypothetical protein
MTALALQRPDGFAVGLAEHSAGPDADELRKQTFCVLKALKTQVRAGSSVVFNELQALAQEQTAGSKASNALRVAQRFLLVLPSSLPPPELAVDAEGEIVMDWTGRGGAHVHRDTSRRRSTFVCCTYVSF